VPQSDAAEKPDRGDIEVRWEENKPKTIRRPRTSRKDYAPVVGRWDSLRRIQSQETGGHKGGGGAMTERVRLFTRVGQTQKNPIPVYVRQKEGKDQYSKKEPQNCSNVGGTQRQKERSAVRTNHEERGK